MIRTREEFETCLQQALEGLEDPPAPGSPEEGRLMALLDEIRGYAPAAEPPPSEDPALARALSDLGARLSHIDAREPRPGRFSGFRFGGDLDGEEDAPGPT